MRKFARAIAAAAMLVATGLAASPAQAVSIGDTEGCTPGYWKVRVHHDSWQEAKPTTLFVDAFRSQSNKDLASPMAPVGFISADLTMLDALNARGGAGIDGARQILARAAAAAWLNAAYDDDDGHLLYPWRRWGASLGDRPSLVPAVVAALSGSDREAMIELAAMLDADNNLGCPLS